MPSLQRRTPGCLTWPNALVAAFEVKQDGERRSPGPVDQLFESEGASYGL